MSRRESRDSDSRHHRSRFDREHSPKRVRRDGKTATERPASNPNMNSAEHIERDQKHRRRLQDSLPHESPIPDPKVVTGPLSKESDKKSNGYREGTKNSSDNLEAPWSRSLFQRAGQADRSIRGRETTNWKDRESSRATYTNTSWNKARDEKAHIQGLDSKKRPWFREKKEGSGSERKEDRGKPLPPSLPPSLPPAVSVEQRESHRMRFQSRGSYKGRDRLNGRQARVEKWKHDLYDEANKSPTSKNEEEQIAKVEALLSS